MKNIKEIRNQELAARAEEEARAARQAELDALPEKNVISTMPDVRAGTIRADRDENGNPKEVKVEVKFPKATKKK